MQISQIKLEKSPITLKDIFDTLDMGTVYNTQLKKITKILSKQSRSRNRYDLEQLEGFFSNSFTYMNVLKEKLSSENYLEVYREIKLEVFDSLQVIFEAGDIGRKMYFIFYGEVGILLPLPHKEAHLKMEAKQFSTTQKGKLFQTFDELIDTKYIAFRLVNTLKQGDYFGEVAIQNRIPRTGTVLTKTKVIAAILTFDTYQKFIQLTQEQMNKDKLTFFRSLALFKHWTLAGLLIILRNCEEIKIKPFEQIFKKGEQLKHIYFIRKGDVKLLIYDDPVQGEVQLLRQSQNRPIKQQVQLGELQFFGEWELFNTNINLRRTNFEHELSLFKRQTSAQTLTHCVIVKMTLVQFIESYKIFGDLSTIKSIVAEQAELRDSLQRRGTEDINTTVDNIVNHDVSAEPFQNDAYSKFFTQRERDNEPKKNSRYITNVSSSMIADRPKKSLSDSRVKTVDKVVLGDYILKIFDTSTLKNRAGYMKIKQMSKALNKENTRTQSAYLDQNRVSSLIRRPKLLEKSVYERFKTQNYETNRETRATEQDSKTEISTILGKKDSSSMEKILLNEMRAPHLGDIRRKLQSSFANRAASGYIYWRPEQRVESTPNP